MSPMFAFYLTVSTPTCIYIFNIVNLYLTKPLSSLFFIRRYTVKTAMYKEEVFIIYYFSRALRSRLSYSTQVE